MIICNYPTVPQGAIHRAGYYFTKIKRFKRWA